MENLQLVLFVLGAIAIIAVLVHGFWSIRKQQPKSLKDSPMAGFYKEQSENRDLQGFDVDGISEVRIRKNEQSVDDEVLTEPIMSDTIKSEPQLSTNIKLQNQTDVEMTSDRESDFSLSDQPKQKKHRHRQEPVLSSPSQEADVLDQMELGLGQQAIPTQNSLFETDRAQDSAQLDIEAEVTSPVYATPVTEAKIQTKPKATPPVTEQDNFSNPRDVLVLHVVATEGGLLNGTDLLPSLLTLNFKFGDMSIFHRHEDNAGTGKVLFSLANMVKPGIFNPDEMEQFNTEGVVLFMTLPCHGDPLMNFSIMLNSAHQLADDLGGKVLDGGRDAWSETNKQSYLQRIQAK
ncbi:MAG: cell division protein ZipA [Shewanella sp.]